MSVEPTESSRQVDDSLFGALAEALYSKSLDCVHCGLCLTSCPTYLVTGRETSSPRGRIYLMRGFVEGRIDDEETLAEEVFLCLGCRACETACPSGVEYGEMLELTRSVIRGRESGFRISSAIEGFMLRAIVPHPRRLSRLVSVLEWAQRFGLDRFAMNFMPQRVKELYSLAPQIPPSNERRRLPAFTPAVGTRRGSVALFEGCVMPEFFGRVNDAARLVLSRAGYDVHVPVDQGCCGALQAHSGELDFAHGLARKNVDVFGANNFDAIVVTSAGCSAALRGLENWLGEAGRPLAMATRDVLEFLDAVGPKIQFSSLAKRVCYDDPCHLIHAQGIAAAPRRLFAQIPDLELIAHRDPESCCGAAGIYNLTQPEMSKKVLAPKLDALIDAAPEIVATANPGCAMQLTAGLKSRGVDLEVVHPIELLEQASRRNVESLE